MNTINMVLILFFIINNGFSQTTLLNEDFDSFTDWKYSAENNSGASFKVKDGVLSANNFGTQQQDWYGVVATKILSSSLDINSTDFTLSAYLISLGGTDKDGYIFIDLMDADNVPVLRLAWCMDYWGNCQCKPWKNDGRGNLCAYAEGKWFYCSWSDFPTISGKATLKKSSGQITIHYNDGPIMGSYTLSTSKIVTKIGVRIMKYGDFTARDMKIDYIKLEIN